MEVKVEGVLETASSFLQAEFFLSTSLRAGFSRTEFLLNHSSHILFLFKWDQWAIVENLSGLTRITLNKPFCSP